MSKTYLSVIIPMYNEHANLKRGVLEEVNKYLKKQKYNWEVIISDDGSTDDSRDFVKQSIKNKPKFSLLKNKHGGKPHALYCGIKKAKGEYILFTDMDQSTPIDQLAKLLPHTNKFEVVIGSRGIDRAKFPFYRRLGSVVFMTFRKIFLLRDIDDTQCGFKLFRTDIVSSAFPKLEFFRNKKQVSGWKVTSYDVELLHIIKKLGHKIKEVTVKWSQEDESDSKGNSLSKYINESQEMLLQIVRVKLNDLKGFYNS